MSSNQQGNHPSLSTGVDPAAAPSSTANLALPPKQPARVPGKPPLPQVTKPPSNTRGRPSSNPKGVLPALGIRPTASASKDGIVKDVVEKESSKQQVEGTPKLKNNNAKPAESVAMDAERTQFEAKLGNVGRQLETELRSMEDEIGRKEEEYIAKTWSHGNVLRGWEGLVRRVERERGGTGSGTGTGAPKYRKTRPSDRIFSLSSGTSQFRKNNPEVMILKRGIEKKKKKKR
eukprot:GFKZ01002967.1.p1 GENE.GFKZ01002967.1~~GFKZ01002967.1.p1  ORF type:complete len:232 (+),score=44.75 GFKZ01002967.1:251-946(+)